MVQQGGHQRADTVQYILILCTFIVIMWAFHSIVFDLVNSPRDVITGRPMLQIKKV